MSDLYQEIILDAYKHPHHKGSLDQADAISEGINASCGDSVKIYVKLTQDNQIEVLSWEGNGCAISQATMSLLSDKINKEHLSLEQVKHLTEQDLLALLGIEEISVGREKCMMIGLKAVQKIKDNS